MNEILSGLIASTVTTCMFYPIDTIKMRLQHHQHLNGQINSIKSVKSLYNGLLPELVGSVPSSILFWYSYSKLRDQYNFSPFQASTCSALVSNFIDTPFDIRKKQRQLFLTSKTTPNLIAKFAAINCAHSIVYNGVYMPMLHLLLQADIPKTFAIFCCCSTASIVTYPIDRFRTQIVAGQTLKTQWWKGLGYRLLFNNLYSGLYMHIYLFLTENKL